MATSRYECLLALRGNVLAAVTNPREWRVLMLSLPAMFALCWEAVGGWKETFALTFGALICPTYPLGKLAVVIGATMPLVCFLGLSLGLMATLLGKPRVAATCFMATLPWVVGTVYLMGFGKDLIGPAAPC